MLKQRPNSMREAIKLGIEQAKTKILSNQPCRTEVLIEHQIREYASDIFQAEMLASDDLTSSRLRILFDRVFGGDE